MSSPVAATRMQCADASVTASGVVGPGSNLAGPAPDAGHKLVELRGITKVYGPTIANADVALEVRAGEILGLVGANGAGKSTLMRVLCGVTCPDSGELRIGGEAVDLASYSPRAAHAGGIRTVYQELSLCSNLTVAENFFLEQPDQAKRKLFWRKSYHDLAAESIDAVFPASGVDVASGVDSMSIGELQMVEIARAASAPGIRLLVLDEPTSSLDSERSAQLRAFVRARAGAGLAVIFISHKLREVIEIADRIVVMRNGRVAWEAPSAGISVSDLVAAMGGTAVTEAEGGNAARRPDASPGAPVLARISGRLTEPLGRPIELRAGEIVGLAGLEGSGQKALLRRLRAAPAGDPEVTCLGRTGFVSGDRQREGVFPLWSVLDNISIGRVGQRSALSSVSPGRERDAAHASAERLQLDTRRLSSGILDLSGGNQQKALVARALVDDADVILLDDPTRGVDIASKREFYRLFEATARSGRLVVWHSTEDPEFLECDRVLVFSCGRIVRELVGAEISEAAILDACFDHERATGAGEEPGKRRRGGGQLLFSAVPFISLALVFACMSWLNPLVASSFGLDLLLGPAVALVLLALAQMFVVGGSEIDLGVGAFAGFVNVVSATLLIDMPAVGALAILGGLLGYAGMATLIQSRKIPAIVVTLGAAFIWTGFGHTLQPTPGGSSPHWLSAAFGWSVPGVPTPVVMIAAVALLAMAIDRSRLGTVLRGFGNNAGNLQRSGWSPLRYAVVRYLIAGAFAAAAGLVMTAVNSSSDVNAGASFTLLTVAAVVIGGCELLGGVISPAGVAAGAVTLSLVGALLAFLGVSTDYNAVVQGLLLIGMLGLRRVTIRDGRAGG